MRNPEEPILNLASTDAPFYLDDWHIDSSANRISRGNSEIKLESKVMAVLLYLVQHANQLVTREALETAVWGKTVVGYDALTRCIAQLRKALGDDIQQPRYIETISKKGYRLIAQVRPVIKIKATIKPRTGRQLWIIATGVLALVALYLFRQELGFTGNNSDDNTQGTRHSQPSIIVLPFTYPGDDPEQAYFSEGVTADITTALSKLSGLLVISQSAALSDIKQGGYKQDGYKKNNSKQASAIRNRAETLGVRYALTGKVRRTADRIRVNVSLIDSHNDTIIWSEKYDRELISVFDVQDDITQNIILALSIKLTDAEKRRTAKRYTISVDAYDDFLRGQALYIRYNQESNLQAREYYQQATERDPAFARAYSAIALTYVAEQRYGWGERHANQMEQALRYANKGMLLDPDLPQAYWVLGYVHLFRREYTAAAEAASRGIALDPNYADTYLTLAICKIHQGVPQEAITLVHKAMRLNPEYPAAYASILGQSYFFNGEYAQSTNAFRDAIERNSHLLTPHVFLIVALAKQGQADDASWAAEQLKSLYEDFNIDKIAQLLPVDDPAIAAEMKYYLQQSGL